MKADVLLEQKYFLYLFLDPKITKKTLSTESHGNARQNPENRPENVANTKNHCLAKIPENAQMTPKKLKKKPENDGIRCRALGAGCVVAH